MKIQIITQTEIQFPIYPQWPRATTRHTMGAHGITTQRSPLTSRGIPNPPGPDYGSESECTHWTEIQDDPDHECYSYNCFFVTEEDIQEDDEIDEYPQEKLKCVVDAKSMLYLYGLELDYSEELIGGGFKFFNPNAEESCGCGSSFGV